MRIQLSSKLLLAVVAGVVCALLAGVVFVASARATTQPTVTSVGVPAASTYAVGQNLNFTVNFDQAVDVNVGGGTPYLPITVGSTSDQAAYVSGTGTTALVFRYTVQTGDSDTDGVAVGSSITLNGGTLVASSDGITNADTTLNSVGSTASVLVDGVAPTVSSANRVSATPTNSTSLHFTVIFSENVSGVDASDFTLTATGTAAGTVSSVSPMNASTYDVTVNTVSGDGTLRLDLNASGTGITDTAGNAIATGFPGGQTYTVDNTAPTVSSVAVPSNGTYSAGQNLDFTVNWSENVTVSTAGGTPRIALTVGSSTVYASYVSGSGTSALVFRYTVQAGDNDSNGIAVGALAANGGTLTDAVGNNATLTLNSVGSTASVNVDAVAPAVSSVDVPAGALYKLGQNLDFTVHFSDNVTVNTGGGTPRMPLTIGSTTRYAAYQSGTGTSALVFRYTVASGDADSDGIAVGTALQANGGTLKDGSGNDAVLTLAGVAATSGITVDAVAPTITSVTAPADGSYGLGKNLDFTVHYSEPVNVVTTGGVPSISLTVGVSSKNAAYVSGTGTKDILFRYTVAAGDADSDGIGVSGLIALNGGTMADAAGNAAPVTLPSGSTAAILVDTTAPSVSSVAAPAAKTYKTGDNVDFSVVFSDKMTVSGTPRLTLTVGTKTVYATYLSGTGTTTLVFRYTVASGDKDTDGIGLSNAIDLNNGTLTDAAGNTATLTLGTLPSLTGVLVDGSSSGTTTPPPPPTGGNGGGGTDTTPPSKPAKVSAKMTRKGGRATDNTAVAGYQILANGKVVKTITATSFFLPVSLPAKAKTMTVQVEAVDKAGNHSAPVTITISRPATPKGVPAKVPGWAYKLTAWQHKPKAKRGKHPATPKHLPGWYWKWAAWQHKPLQVTVS